MKFYLDSGNRFLLQSADLGFELVVDKKTVHYCRTHVDALNFMFEELSTEDMAEGVEQVLSSLDRIYEKMMTAASVIDIVEASKKLKKVIECARSNEGRPRKDVVRSCATLVADCTLAELNRHPERKRIAAEVKAALRVWDL